jgi:hypothetical protein
MISIADNLLSLLISFIHNFILNILPINLTWLSLSDFSAYFSSASTNLLTAYNEISYIMPIKLILGLIIAVLFAEVLLVGIRGIKYIFAQIRGSGT